MIRIHSSAPLALAFVFGLAAPARASVVNYCVGAPNSTGVGARIAWSGPQTSHGPQSGSLVVRNAPANSFGVFLYGLERAQNPFGDGFACVGGATWILARKATSANGAVALNVHQESDDEDVRWLNYNHDSVWHFQYLYRDPTGPGGTGFNLTDAVEVDFR